MYPIFFLICSVCEYASNPATLTSPEVGFESPERIRITVVFPAPFAPRNPKISPEYTSKLRLSLATKLPNFFTRERTVITELFIFLFNISHIQYHFSHYAFEP